MARKKLLVAEGALPGLRSCSQRGQQENKEDKSAHKSLLTADLARGGACQKI